MPERHARRYPSRRTARIKRAKIGRPKPSPRGNVFATRHAFIRRISRPIFEKRIAAAAEPTHPAKGIRR